MFDVLHMVRSLSFISGAIISISLAIVAGPLVVRYCWRWIRGTVSGSR